MKALSPDLAAHLASGTTTLAWCWKIIRADGAIMGFTDHDRALVFAGTTFEPDSGFAAAEIRVGSDLSVDAQDAEGALSSDRITETDILDGRWDNALVELWRVNWQDADQRVLMRRGAIGELRRGMSSFVAEIRSLSHLLGQTAGRVFQGSCDAELGDGRCRVDLDVPAYAGQGQVADPAKPPGVPPNACNTWKGPMMRCDTCWKPGRIGPAIAMTLLTGCGTAGSDHGACPPVVQYPAAVQQRAAAEIEAMPKNSAVVGMMADYHVLRRQVRGCRGAEIDSKS